MTPEVHAASQSHQALESALRDLVTALVDADHDNALALFDHRIDEELAAAIFDVTLTVKLEGRGIHLRFACRWLGEAFAALASGRVDEAERWLEKASADLERYRRGPTEASFAAVEGSTT